MIRLLSKQETLSHFLSLSPEDRYTRFCCAASDDFIRSYVNREVGFFYGIVEHGILHPVNKFNLPSVFIDGVRSDRATVAVLHIVHDINTKSIEVAVSVLPEYKGKGLAKKLMYFAAGVATAYQAEKLVVTGLSINSPMVHLAKSCGYKIQTEYGEFEGEASTIGHDLKTIIENNIKIFKILLGVGE